MNLDWDFLPVIEKIYSEIGWQKDGYSVANKSDLIQRLNFSIPEAFLEELDGLIKADEVSIDEFMSIFAPFVKQLAPNSPLNDSRTSQNSQGNSNDSSLSVFNDENGIPEGELIRAPQDLESFLEPNSIAYSVGTYSAYGDSPMKPLRESTSANSIKAQNEKEIEALRKKVNYQSTEYDKLLEKLNSSEHECKNYQTKIANLEKKNKLLRNSNNDLNVELKGMSIMKNEIEEKNQEIGRLQATIIEKGKQQESSWATVEQLRQEIETLRGQIEDEQGNSEMLQREMELKETAHKKTISEHNVEQARLISNLEEKENNLNITKKDLDRITRERAELKNHVEDLEAKIEENGEIIQFTEQQDFVTSVHAELAQDAEYLKSRDDEINRLTQEIDHSSQRELKLKDKICELEDQLNDFRSEMKSIESIRSRQEVLKLSTSAQTDPEMKPSFTKNTQTVQLHAPVQLPNRMNLATNSPNRISRFEKIATIATMLLAILISLIYKREEPWIEVNCPGNGQISTH